MYHGISNLENRVTKPQQEKNKFHVVTEDKQVASSFVGVESLITFGGDTSAAKELPSGTDLYDSMNFEDLPYCPVYLLGKNEDGGNVYKCCISSTIEDVSEYFNLLEILLTMSDKDAIQLSICSPGGYVATGTMISEAISRCKGFVHTYATGICASAGSLIWSAGHKCDMSDTAVFMYHMSSHFDANNSKSIEIEARHMVEYVRRAFLEVSVRKGHITKEEADLIYSEPDREIWIPAKEMRERILNFQSTQVESTDS